MTRCSSACSSREGRRRRDSGPEQCPLTPRACGLVPTHPEIGFSPWRQAMPLTVKGKHVQHHGQKSPVHPPVSFLKGQCFNGLSAHFLPERKKKKRKTKLNLNYFFFLFRCFKLEVNECFLKGRDVKIVALQTTQPLSKPHRSAKTTRRLTGMVVFQ